MPKRRFFNIKNFRHMQTVPVVYTTIQDVSWSDDIQELAASGDDDKVDTWLAQGKRTTRGTITMTDPVQAEALVAATPDDITFDGEPEPGGLKVTVTLKNVVFFGIAHRTLHNGVWGQSLNFRCHDPSGGDVATIVLETPPP